MILPAFGSLTGGLDAGHPEILGALQPAARIEALMPAKGRIARSTKEPAKDSKPKQQQPARTEPAKQAPKRDRNRTRNYVSGSKPEA